MFQRLAIVGCGLIGKKRAQAAGDARIVACADVQRDRAEALAKAIADAANPVTSAAPIATDDWRAAVTRSDVDIVVVATTNDVLAEVTHAALAAGKHVLVEKPAA